MNFWEAYRTKVTDMRKLILVLTCLLLLATNKMPDYGPQPLTWHQVGGVVLCRNATSYVRAYVFDSYWYTQCGNEDTYLVFLQYNDGRFFCWDAFADNSDTCERYRDE